MPKVTTTIEVTEAQLTALRFCAEDEHETVEETIAWITRKGIYPLLETTEARDDEQRKELMAALRDEGND